MADLQNTISVSLRFDSICDGTILINNDWSRWSVAVDSGLQSAFSYHPSSDLSWEYPQSILIGHFGLESFLTFWDHSQICCVAKPLNKPKITSIHFRTYYFLHLKQFFLGSHIWIVDLSNGLVCVFRSLRF